MTAYIITMSIFIMLVVQKIVSAKRAHNKNDLKKYKLDLIVLTMALVGGTVLVVLMRHMLDK